MSRHRNIRSLDVDEEYEGYYSCYGHSVEDDICVSPNTEAQFLYDRNASRQSSSAYYETHEPVIEEDDSEEEYALNNLETPTIKAKLSDLDLAKLQSCVEAMQDIVGDTISETILQEVAIEHKFDLEQSLNAVLKDKAPKPKRNNTVKEQVPSTNVKSKPVSNTDIVSDSPKLAKKEKICSADVKNIASEIENQTTDSPKSSVEKKSLTQIDCKDISDKSSEESQVIKLSKIEKNAKEIFKNERADKKPLLNLVVIGHVDAGKSTLMGHLLYKLGNISQRNMHKFEKDSKKLGKGSFMFAWVLDETPEERNRGITMDVAFSTFETSSKSVVLLDAPGHKDFIPNMITGAAQADVAILVIDSTRGEFETGFETGGQTREHTMLIRSLGVSEIAVAINKMDNIDFSEDRFKDICSKLSTFLKQVGFKENDIYFVPCSGLSGENLINSPQCPNFKKWYSGPTLVDVIDNFHPPERPIDKPFRMCVNDVFKGTSGGFCASGKIDAGIIKSGDKILVMPSCEQATVKGISVEDKQISYGFAGDQVSLQLHGIDSNNILPGSMICNIERPVKATTCFQARIIIFNITVPITKGFPVILHFQSLSQQAIIKKLISLLHRSTGEVVKNKPRCLSKHSNALVEIEMDHPICLELFQDFKDLGRIMLRSNGSTIAAGLVTCIK